MKLNELSKNTVLTDIYYRSLAPFHDSSIYTILEGKGGGIYSDNEKSPTVILARLGDFRYLWGSPAKIDNIEEVLDIKGEETTLVCSDNNWINYLGESIISAHFYRYRLETPKSFDIDSLKKIRDKINKKDGFSLRQITKEDFDSFDSLSFGHDFKGISPDFNDFQENSLGFVIAHGEKILSGACAYSYYSGGYEIQIETDRNYRNMGLASICSAAFIIESIKRGKKPHWDAAHEQSYIMAQKLGFVPLGRYDAYNLKRKGNLK